MAYHLVKSSRIRVDSVIVFDHETTNVPVHIVHDVEREDSIKDNQEDDEDDVANDGEDEVEESGIHLDSLNQEPRGKKRCSERVEVMKER